MQIWNFSYYIVCVTKVEIEKQNKGKQNKNKNKKTQKGNVAFKNFFILFCMCYLI